jgi:hypothetical protein
MFDSRFTMKDALTIGKTLQINWQEINLEQFRLGLEVELEHGKHDPSTDVTGDDPIKTGKIALAHLKEIPDYYTRLAVLESEAETHWKTVRAPGRNFAGDEEC